MRQPFGQNFLVDTAVARNIVAAAELAPGDRVLEIGPGRGILTSLIAAASGDLTAVELDRDLAAALQARFAGRSGVRVVREDFLRFPFAEIAGPLKVVANLPYNVATAIVEKILPAHTWTVAVLMVQKEVGERIAARTCTRAYGAFSLLCQYYADVSIILKVGPGSFFPKPKVDSVVLRLVNRCRQPLDPDFLSFVRSAFLQRRKTAVNSLSRTLDLPKPAVIAAARTAGIPETARPEEIDFEGFCRLFSALHKGPPTLDFRR